MICPSCGAENLEGNDRCENCLASFRDLDVPDRDQAEGLARHVMEDTLRELDQESPIIVSLHSPAIEVVQQMKQANSGCALVLDGSKLVGIFTEHDVLTRLSRTISETCEEANDARGSSGDDIPFPDVPLGDIPLEEIRGDELQAEEKPLADAGGSDVTGRLASALQIPVSDLMSSNPETLHEHESIAFALNRMSIGRFRHIPVAKEDGSYSVASIKSVLKYIAQEDW
ncbi:MAG TPA: CBS domain-containing protein [Pyrinomonadaceae bacterium]|nr:CBS domain-containing protein [Pyrinomonadaceae bacterium]